MMAIVVLVTCATAAYAVDRVAKFDLNTDGKVTFEELSVSCNVRKSLFDIADKNKDGFLTNKEMREAKNYLFNTCSK